MKELIVVGGNKGSLYSVEIEGGGRKPDAVKGLFTSPVLAQAKIDKHLSTKKEVKNVDKPTKSRAK